MPITDELRPDPDLLLEKVTRETSRAERGRLRIYFGSSAGVGKTYAMLSAARKLKSDGCDVVVGVIETHGRAETGALLEVVDGVILPVVGVEVDRRALEPVDVGAPAPAHRGRQR